VLEGAVSSTKDLVETQNDKSPETVPERSRARIYLKQVEAHEQHQNWGSIIADSTEAIRLDPNFPQAYVKRGMAHMQMGDLKESLADFDRALLLDPERKEALIARGMVRIQTNDFLSAINDLHRGNASELAEYTLFETQEGVGSVFTESMELEDYLREAQISLDQSQWDDAIDFCTQAIRLNPGIVETYICRASAYASKDEIEYCLLDCDEAIFLDPRNFIALVLRGMTKVVNGDTIGGITDLKTAIEIAPDHPGAGYVKETIGAYRTDGE